MKPHHATLHIAYTNLHALMKNRGFHPLKGSEFVPIEKFKPVVENWESRTGDVWLQFANPSGDSVDVAFIGTIEKSVADGIVAYANSKTTEQGKLQRDAHLIIVADVITSPALPLLITFKRQPFERSQRVKIPRIELFTVKEMLINPLRCSRQPDVIRLITSEEEKEEIRRSLLAATDDKDKALGDLLPIIYFEKQLSVWFDAYVGDVFYFVRQDGTPYFRIVKPDPQIEKLKSDKGSKVDSSENGD